ncbi:MAG: PP2C family protein-serine/threonine phosphatase [Desulfobacterales bacterium]|jgi:serine phosphatase RsbU (regulator of sigma subunit)
MGAWTFFLRKGVTVVVPECHLHSQDRLVNSWQNGCKSAGSPSGKPYAALKKRSLDSNTSQDLFDFTATNSDTRNLAILMIISLITSSTKFSLSFFRTILEKRIGTLDNGNKYVSNDDLQIGIDIGDVSGRGISSALLMAAVRSALRQRSFLPGSAAEIIRDVNHQLVGDVEDSGQFVTMFYLTVDPIKKHLQYVRAGHDPAIFYDPNTNTFEELGGTGMALGVEKNWNVNAYAKTALENGQIIFLSTDGIWEARNFQGEMFGKEPIYEIIRNNSSLSANEILNAMTESLKGFQKGAKIEDDITLVIIKITD